MGAVFLLILIAAIWGATFPLVRDGIAGVPTLPFLQIRFLVAAGILVPIPPRAGDSRGCSIPAASRRGSCWRRDTFSRRKGSARQVHPSPRFSRAPAS